MKTIISPILIAILFFSCNCNSNTEKESKEATQKDSVQYYPDLESGQVIIDMFRDSMPHPQKVIAYFEVGDESLDAFTNDEGSFFTMNKRYYFDSVKGISPKEILIFAEYYGTKKDDEYELYVSHAQAPNVTYGIYEYKENKGWYLLKKSNADFNKDYRSYGQYGQIGELRLAKSGEWKYALAFNRFYSGQGYSEQGISYYDIEMEREIFSVSETTSNDGAVENGYSYGMEAGFIPSNQERYDLELISKGTHYDGDEASKVVPFYQKDIYRYEPRLGKYAIFETEYQ